MNRIEKALRRLTPKERGRIREVLRQLQAGNAHKLDIKKLRGREDIFRVRKGDLRILYRTGGDQIFVLAIERRSEKTYRP